jgi:hypothetical protein
MQHFLKLFWIVIFLIVSISPQLTFSQTNETWHIVVSKATQQDKAIELAVDDLQTEGKKYGIEFKVKLNARKISTNTILVGPPERNKLVANLAKKGTVEFQKFEDPLAFEINTIQIKNNQVMIVAGGSILGDTFGLYWIWDRLRVNKGIPEMNITRIPELKIRYTQADSKEDMRNALRYGATWVTGGPSSNHLVPWDVEPERTENEKNRNNLRELINYAHELHLKFIVLEDEFSYHPTLLKEFGAELSPDDPAFWDAFQAKYRRLLKIMPEIDGIRFRTGESTRVGGNYKSFDLLHDGEHCDWSLAKRYRTLVKKMYNVIVGEFDKIYYQRTWVTSAHEQHSMAAVYKEIFTDDIPVKNLYMSPYLSTTDRYFFQPYNPTFNLTPHNMVVLLAPLDYHGHGDAKIFPTFPGTYYQGGIKSILAADKTNLKGAHFGVPIDSGWDSWNITSYTATRLAWDPNEDLKTIARDYAAMYFGQPAADDIAELFMLSPKAYKYGVYIEPVAHGDFRSLPHLRLTTFPAKGLPRLDSGKKHIDFLYDIYLRCSPWKTETLLYLDHGLDIAQQMKTISVLAEKNISDKELATRLTNSVELTWWLVKTNNLYVKTIFDYFDYRNNPTIENKKILEKRSQELQTAKQTFLNTPNCVYRLDGMEQLLKNVEEALEDLPIAENALANAPGDDGINALILEQQTKSKDVLLTESDKAVKVLHWRARVDGRDLVKIHADKLEVEHLRYDNISEMSYEFSNPLPQKKVTLIVKDIQSRSFRPFVLEQPSAENEFTATIYLSDYPEHGYSWWEFEIYYLEKSPAELGLKPPWN